MKQGKVVSLQLSVGHRQPMAFQERVTVVDGGLQGDRHANPRSLRQVLLMEKEILDRLSLSPGTIRENVTIEGLSIHGLEPGAQVRLGADVVLEVTGLCEPCSRMDEIRDGLQRTLDRQRGVLTRVIAGGQVALGDGISLAA